MKLFVASDIHGSSLYCRMMLDAFCKEGADKLLLLGDILYHGPRNDLPEGYAPKDVISLLNPIADRIICVRGNCEAEVDQMVLDFPLMADYSILNINGKTLFATHGHRFSVKTPPKMKEYYILLNGHTHVSAIEEHDGFLYVNPGSVSIPKEDTARGYAVIDEEGITLKDLFGKEIKEYKL